MRRHAVFAVGLAGACVPPAPAPTPPAAPPTRITPQECVAWASDGEVQCGHDRTYNLDTCTALARLAEAASCLAQARRSFACDVKRTAPCRDKACCAATLGACDEINTELDHCIRGYCGEHAANPDCAWAQSRWSL